MEFDNDEVPVTTTEEKDSVLMGNRDDFVQPGEVKFRFWKFPFVVIIPLLLLCSYALNIWAFFLPFMTITIYKHDPETLDITSLLKLMWDDGLYWPTCLLVAFSICFPIFKLISLTTMFLMKKHGTKTRRFLRVLSFMGRFSLLDIFVELVVLTLAHGQGEVDIKVFHHVKRIVLLIIDTHHGLSFFIAAICINMTISEMMCNLEVTEKMGSFVGKDGERRYLRPLTSNKVIMVAVPTLWCLTGSALACAWYYPFIELTARFLHHFTYNLFQVGYFMFTDEYYLFGMMVLTFVVIMPAVKHISIALVWIFSQKTRTLERNLEITKAIGKWAMTDVFTLSYTIFALISD